MNQRLVVLMNKPGLANFHHGFLVLLIVLAVFSYPFIDDASVQSTYKTNANTPSKKASVGVIDGKGEWVIPPRYLQIIYLRKSDKFWVKVRESDASNCWFPEFLHCVGRNTAWKLLDRNGVEMASHLPYMTEPVCNEMADFGASIHPDMLVVKKNYEYGYCELDGRSITGCHYSFICDVGHGIWLAAETKKDLSDRQMPIVVLDHSGRKVRTLDEKINFLFHHGNGVLECFRQGQSGYVDYRAEFIPLAVNEHSPAWIGAATLNGQPVVYKNLAHYPISSAEPVRWVDVVKNPAMSNYVFQVPFVDNRAVIGCADNCGLVDTNGSWLLQPTFKGLLYCNKDRLIAHKRQRTTEEIQLERYEHIGSLTGSLTGF
ncbi:hypothetical protein BH11CYA1_BH11CYA1_45000 [soil metagenome]